MSTIDRVPKAIVIGFTFLICLNATAQVDPLGSNNSVYPPNTCTTDPNDCWSGGFRVANYDYPSGPVTPGWTPGAGMGAITTANAEQYMVALKNFIAEDISGLVNTPHDWDPQTQGWYDMPWTVMGSPLPDGRIDPNSGRESIQGSYTGQILQPDTFPNNKPTVPFQNHAVTFYNDVAATLLAQIWKDPYDPNLENTQFPEGSIVVKVESATLTPEQWAPVTNSSLAYVWRPTVATIEDKNQSYKTPTRVPVRFSQMAVAVKDSVASPQTGWVYMAFAYDWQSNGQTVWDRAVPVGAMWGNDPQFANNPNGTDPSGGPLTETWVSTHAPTFTHATLGWGGRLAGPMDVATRHNVITVGGDHYGEKPLAASSCLSCHGSAQFPFAANLYPSPNLVFPEDGNQFLLFNPGSDDWARWFQNYPGDQPMSGFNRTGFVGLDYDLLLTFALGTYQAHAGNILHVVPTIHVH